jgi:hypothetical protein
MGLKAAKKIVLFVCELLIELQFSKNNKITKKPLYEMNNISGFAV